MNTDWLCQAFGPSTWSNWALALFAAGAIIIGLVTLAKISAQTKAAVVAANAAGKSAEVAELALNIERPFIFVESPKWTMRAELGQPLERLRHDHAIDAPKSNSIIGESVWAPPPQLNKFEFEASYMLRNCGKGVAIIDGIKARFHLAPTKWGKPTDAERAQMKTLKATLTPIHDRVISPTEQSRNFIFGFFLDPSTWLNVQVGKSELLLFGFVRYHDTFEKWSYRQDFCFRYLVGSFDAQTIVVDNDWFFAGPDKNNRSRKCKYTVQSAHE